MTTTTLVLRRRDNISRSLRQFDDFDIFDGDRDVGRIYLVDRFNKIERWFWGVDFQITARRMHGSTSSLDAAKAEFRAQYEEWKAGQIPAIAVTHNTPHN
jgi:hypothetical protein